jgi:hypothetical protein
VFVISKSWGGAPGTARRPARLNCPVCLCVKAWWWWGGEWVDGLIVRRGTEAFS